MTRKQYEDIANACNVIMAFEDELVVLGWSTNIGAENRISHLRDVKNNALKLLEDTEGEKGEWISEEERP